MKRIPEVPIRSKLRRGPKDVIPAKIAAIYAGVGMLWILFSDRILSSIIDDPALLTRLQTYKGWLFALVTFPSFAGSLDNTLISTGAR